MSGGASAALAAFYDVEASGLDPRSWPVEVGWALVAGDLTVTSGALLVRPEPTWAHWSAEAERVHGVPLRLARERGRPAG